MSHHHHHRRHIRPYAVRYVRRTRRSAIPPGLILTIVALAALAVLTALVLFASGLESRQAPARSTADRTLGESSLRPIPVERSQPLIYPYSIVAGGARSPHDLREAIAADPVVANHYSNFNLSRLRTVRMPHDEYAYVSFRVGDGVYWTRHELKLRKGEMMITDGEHFGRTRCGNQLSQTRRLPNYIHEPSAKVLNTPLPRDTKSFAALTPPVLELPGDLIEPDRLLSAVGVPAIASFQPVPFMPFMTPSFASFGCDPGNHRSSPDSKCNTAKRPPPPSPTPESNCAILFVIGGGVLAGYGFRRRAARAVAEP